MAFGQFWILSFGKAVVRRPSADRHIVPHFNYIDEFAILLHPDVEEFFSLHRQYVCANFVAFQTLDQMNKSRETEYLKGVLLGNCATQILFGRISPTEMQTYERMAGMVASDLEQQTVSETSITTENPSYSYSTRTTMQMEKRMEGSDMRYRDFQEVTMFTVKAGSPEEPFVGRVEFLPASRRKGTPRIKVYWRQFITDDVYDPRTMGKRFSPWYRQMAEDDPLPGRGFRVDATAAAPEENTAAAAAPEGQTAAAAGNSSSFRFTSRGVVSSTSMTVYAGKASPPAGKGQKAPPSPEGQPSPPAITAPDPGPDGDGGLNALFDSQGGQYDGTQNVRSSTPPASLKKSRRRTYTASAETPEQPSTGSAPAGSPPAAAAGRTEDLTSPEEPERTAAPEEKTAAAPEGQTLKSSPEGPQEARTGDFTMPVGENLAVKPKAPERGAETPSAALEVFHMPEEEKRTDGEKEERVPSGPETWAEAEDGDSLAALFEDAPVFSGSARPAAVAGQDVILPPAEDDADGADREEKKGQGDDYALSEEARYEKERAARRQEEHASEQKGAAAPDKTADPEKMGVMIVKGFI